MFVGALHSVKHWRILRLLILIIVAGALALLIAPSSAILLQPRYQNVPAGGTAYFLPAAADQLWRSEVNGPDQLSECFEVYSAQNIVCASAGFDSLRSYFQNLNSSFIIPQMLWDTYQLQPIVVQSLAATIPHLLNRVAVFGLARETFGFQPNAMTTIFQNALTNDWRDGTRWWSGSRFSAVGQYRYGLNVSQVLCPQVRWCSPDVRPHGIFPLVQARSASRSRRGPRKINDSAVDSAE